MGAVSSSCSSSALLVCCIGYLRVALIEKSGLRGLHINESVGGKGRTGLTRGDYPFKVPPFIGVDAAETESITILLEPESTGLISRVINIDGKTLRMV